MNKLSVKSIRINAGLTQEDVANELGISVRSYSDKENGKSRWLWDEILLICRLCNISPEIVK